MGLDYAAIATPNGINEGFANLAAAVARMPLARRQQWLQERKLDQEDRALSAKEAGNPALDAYRKAMGDAATMRAQNQGAHYSNMDATGSAKVAETVRHHGVTEDQGATGLDIKGMDVDNRNTNREKGTAGRLEHWNREDAQGDTRNDIAQQNADTAEGRLGVAAAGAVPDSTYKLVLGDFGGQKSVRESRNLTPEAKAAEGQRLLNGSRPAAHARAMGDKGPAAPAAPKESGKVVRTSKLRAMVQAGQFPDMETAEAAARAQGHGVVDDEQQGP